MFCHQKEKEALGFSLMENLLNTGQKRSAMLSAPK
jgi:hypothetical protein